LNLGCAAYSPLHPWPSPRAGVATAGYWYGRDKPKN
jgi:hypothetical protein